MVHNFTYRKNFAEGKKSSKAKWFFYIFSVILFLFAVYYFSEIEKEIKLLGEINSYWLAAALLLQLSTYLITAFIYQALLTSCDIQHKPSLAELLHASVISLFFNQTVPSAGISGNTFLLNYLLRLNAGVFKSISIILLELLLYYVAMETLILFFLGSSFFYRLPAVFVSILIAGGIVYFLFGATVLLITKKRSLDFILKKIEKIKFLRKRFQAVEQNWLATSKNDHSIDLFPFFIHKKKGALKIIFYQIVICVLDSLTIYALFYGFGEKASFFLIVLVLINTRIIAILPFSPGALILYESSMVFLFTQLNYALGTSIIVTLLFRFLSFWLPIPAGWFLYRKWLKSKSSHKQQA